MASIGPPAPRLVRPGWRWQPSFLDAIREFHAEGRLTELPIATVRDHFADLLAQWERERHRATTPAHLVPQTYRWLVDGDRYIGRVSIRHELNDRLLAWGGHIGYEIRPSERRKGYGTAALRLGLVEARQLGLERVLVTCDAGNTGSRKIIERNGGVLENEVRIPGLTEPKRRYWITTGPATLAPRGDDHRNDRGC